MTRCKHSISYEMSNPQDLLELEERKELEQPRKNRIKGLIHQVPITSQTGIWQGVIQKTAKGNSPRKGKIIFRKFVVKHAKAPILLEIRQLFDNDTINVQTLEAERDCLDKLKVACTTGACSCSWPRVFSRFALAQRSSARCAG